MSLRLLPSMNWSTSVITLAHLLTMNTSAPEVEDLLRYVAVDAVDERHHRDDRRHADHHTQQREHGAQLVRPQRQQGDADGLSDVHASLLGRKPSQFTSLQTPGGAVHPAFREVYGKSQAKRAATVDT